MHQKTSLKPVEIYGIAGRKGHGKDTFANLIIEASAKQRFAHTKRLGATFRITHFAKVLKRMAARIFSINELRFNDPSLKETLFDFPIDMDIYLDIMRQETGLQDIKPLKKIANNPRELMQFFGTEYVRSIQNDYWIQRLIGDVFGDRRILVPDTRFLNEAEALRKIGGLIIKVVRIDSFNNSDSHASETEMDKIEPDLLLGIRTGDLSLPQRVANLIATGKFRAAKKYDYRTAQTSIKTYLSGKTLEESSIFLGQNNKDPYVLKNILDYYKIDYGNRRKRDSNRIEHRLIDGSICKLCGRCKKWISVKHFNASSQSWDLLHGFCRICASDDNTRLYKKYNNSLESIFNITKRSAKYRGKSFNLTLKQIQSLWDKQKGICYYSGVEMTTETNNPNKLTIDRMDSTKGYELDNVALCTYRVNLMKREMTITEFKDIITTLHASLGKIIFNK